MIVRDAKRLFQRNDAWLAFLHERHAAVESVDVFLVILAGPCVCWGEELAWRREMKYIDWCWLTALFDKVRNALFE